MSGKTAKWNTVWVVGASSGIGYELARLLDGLVETVAVSARSKENLAELARVGGSSVSYTLDISDAAAVADCVKQIEAAHGSIDLAVLNAATWSQMDAAEFDLDAVRRGIDVNYMGVVNALHAVLPPMLARGRGHIAITASMAGYRGLPQSIAYGPTKAALINLAETLKTELAPKGILVSLVNPGFVDTPMTRNNPFPMPQIISAPKAAENMLAGLQAGKFEIAFPFQFAMTMKFLRIIPNNLFFWIVRRFIMSSTD